MQQISDYYISADGGYFDEDGYLFVMGRIDDVINVVGHRLSTREIEEIINSHDSIADIGIRDESKDQLALVISKDGVTENENKFRSELTTSTHEKIGAITSLKQALQVSRLPKTRSGKILHRTLRQIASGKNWTTPSTIITLTAYKKYNII